MRKHIMLSLQVTSTVSTQICWGYSSMVASLRRRTIFSWGIMWIEGSSRWRPSACCSPTRSNTQKTSSCSGGTMSVPPSTASMASMMSVSSCTLAAVILKVRWPIVCFVFVQRNNHEFLQSYNIGNPKKRNFVLLPLHQRGNKFPLGISILKWKV